MEPESSLPLSQQPVTGFCFEPGDSSEHLLTQFVIIYSYITLASTTSSSNSRQFHCQMARAFEE